MNACAKTDGYDCMAKLRAWVYVCGCVYESRSRMVDERAWVMRQSNDDTVTGEERVSMMMMNHDNVVDVVKCIGVR